MGCDVCIFGEQDVGSVVGKSLVEFEARFSDVLVKAEFALDEVNYIA